MDSSGSDEHQHDITEFNFTDIRRREEIVAPTSTKQQMSDDSSLSAQREDILRRIDEDRKHVRKEALFRITDEFKLNVYFLFRLNCLFLWSQLVSGERQTNIMVWFRIRVLVAAFVNLETSSGSLKKTE